MSASFSARLKKAFAAKTPFLSAVSLLLLFTLSLFSEWITNDKPVIGYINNKLIFPAYVDYNLEDLGSEGAGLIDYKEFKDEFKYVLWPRLPWGPFENDTDLSAFPSPPSRSHIFGVDVAGRDVFARLLYGTRISFFFALAVWIATFTIGTVIGLIQGFFGGAVDMIGQRLVEVFSSTPQFYVLLLLITILSPNIYILVGLSTVFGWVSISQFMRGEALKNRNLVFVEAARALGASRTRILFHHVLPNSLVPLITFSPFAIVGAIFGLSALDFLGFGVPAPTPSWGELLEQARSNFQEAWWLAAFPSAFIFLTVVWFNFIGEAIRETFDPRG